MPLNSPHARVGPGPVQLHDVLGHGLVLRVLWVHDGFHVVVGGAIQLKTAVNDWLNGLH